MWGWKEKVGGQEDQEAHHRACAWLKLNWGGSKDGGWDAGASVQFMVPSMLVIPKAPVIPHRSLHAHHILEVKVKLGH